jgi:hypothetical protein
VTLSQTHYVEKMLSQFGYSNSKTAPTPYDASSVLRKNLRIIVDQLRYSQIIGSLMYLASSTRPDIAYAFSKLSRFVSNPCSEHWRALERVMRYLVGIPYSGDPKVLVMQIGSLMLMSYKSQVDMCSHLEVALFPRSLASRPF